MTAYDNYDDIEVYINQYRFQLNEFPLFHISDAYRNHEFLNNKCLIGWKCEGLICLKISITIFFFFLIRDPLDGKRKSL